MADPNPGLGPTPGGPPGGGVESGAGAPDLELLKELETKRTELNNLYAETTRNYEALKRELTDLTVGELSDDTISKPHAINTKNIEEALKRLREEQDQKVTNANEQKDEAGLNKLLKDVKTVLKNEEPKLQALKKNITELQELRQTQNEVRRREVVTVPLKQLLTVAQTLLADTELPLTDQDKQQLNNTITELTGHKTIYDGRVATDKITPAEEKSARESVAKAKQKLRDLEVDAIRRQYRLIGRHSLPHRIAEIVQELKAQPNPDQSKLTRLKEIQQSLAEFDRQIGGAADHEALRKVYDDKKETLKQEMVELVRHDERLSKEAEEQEAVEQLSKVEKINAATTLGVLATEAKPISDLQFQDAVNAELEKLNNTFTPEALLQDPAFLDRLEAIRSNLARKIVGTMNADDPRRSNYEGKTAQEIIDLAIEDLRDPATPEKKLADFDAFVRQSIVETLVLDRTQEIEKKINDRLRQLTGRRVGGNGNGNVSAPGLFSRNNQNRLTGILAVAGGTVLGPILKYQLTQAAIQWAGGGVAQLVGWLGPVGAARALSGGAGALVGAGIGGVVGYAIGDIRAKREFRDAAAIINDLENRSRDLSDAEKATALTDMVEQGKIDITNPEARQAVLGMIRRHYNQQADKELKAALAAVENDKDTAREFSREQNLARAVTALLHAHTEGSERIKEKNIVEQTLANGTVKKETVANEKYKNIRSFIDEREKNIVGERRRAVLKGVVTGVGLGGIFGALFPPNSLVALANTEYVVRHPQTLHSLGEALIHGDRTVAQGFANQLHIDLLGEKAKYGQEHLYDLAKRVAENTTGEKQIRALHHLLSHPHALATHIDSLVELAKNTPNAHEFTRLVTQGWPGGADGQAMAHSIYEWLTRNVPEHGKHPMVQWWNMGGEGMLQGQSLLGFLTASLLAKTWINGRPYGWKQLAEINDYDQIANQWRETLESAEARDRLPKSREFVFNKDIMHFSADNKKNDRLIATEFLALPEDDKKGIEQGQKDWLQQLPQLQGKFVFKKDITGGWVVYQLVPAREPLFGGNDRHNTPDAQRQQTHSTGTDVSLLQQGKLRVREYKLDDVLSLTKDNRLILSEKPADVLKSLAKRIKPGFFGPKAVIKDYSEVFTDDMNNIRFMAVDPTEVAQYAYAFKEGLLNDPTRVYKDDINELVKNRATTTLTPPAPGAPPPPGAPPTAPPTPGATPPTTPAPITPTPGAPAPSSTSATPSGPTTSPTTPSPSTPPPATSASSGPAAPGAPTAPSVAPSPAPPKTGPAPTGPVAASSSPEPEGKPSTPSEPSLVEQTTTAELPKTKEAIEAKIDSLRNELLRPAPTVQVIADIHGSDLQLDRVIDQYKDQYGPAEKILFLGDFIDRGPNSLFVLERVKQLVDAGKAEFLLGNHEAMFIGAMEGDDKLLQSWMENGGDSVLREVGIVVIDNKLPDKIRNDPKLKQWAEWLKQNGKIFTIKDGQLYVHAGLALNADGTLATSYAGKKGVAALEAMEEDLRKGALKLGDYAFGESSPLFAASGGRAWEWYQRVRNPDQLFDELNAGRPDDDRIARIVYGHTPPDLKDGRIRTDANNRILGIDAGLATNYGGHGGSLYLDAKGIRFLSRDSAAPGNNPVIEDRGRTIADTDQGRDIKREIARLEAELAKSVTPPETSTIPANEPVLEPELVDEDVTIVPPSTPAVNAEPEVIDTVGQFEAPPYRHPEAILPKYEERSALPPPVVTPEEQQTEPLATTVEPEQATNEAELNTAETALEPEDALKELGLRFDDFKSNEDASTWEYGDILLDRKSLMPIRLDSKEPETDNWRYSIFTSSGWQPQPNSKVLKPELVIWLDRYYRPPQPK